MLFSTSLSHAQGDITRIDVQARMDWQDQWKQSTLKSDDSGFRGKYLVARMDGRYGDHLTYSIRQRFNRAHADESYFNSTDWANITWAFNDRFSISGGKQVVAVGGFEYDRAPIDLYQCSEYWNNIACYQFGVSAAWKLSKSDNLSLQICQSPNRAAVKDMYAVNFMWNGSHGPWSAIWTLNAIESKPGDFIGYIALGNKFTAGITSLELDLMSRPMFSEFDPVDDISVMAELAVRPSERLNIFTKYSYDKNGSNNLDFCVLPDTEVHRIGGGMEYFPVRDSRILRLHAQVSYADGTNTNPYGVLGPKQFLLDMGVTLNLDVLKAIRKH